MLQNGMVESSIEAKIVGMMCYNHGLTVVKQAKIMKQKAGLEEDEDDDDDDDEDEREPTAWGKSKKLYFGADNVDFEVRTISSNKRMTSFRTFATRLGNRPCAAKNVVMLRSHSKCSFD